MFRRRIRYWSVVRFRPNSAAAPLGPLIRPFVFLKASRIVSRSTSRRLRLPAGPVEARSVCGGLNSSSGTSRHSPVVRITARSMKFCNSRMFPGHLHSVMACNAGVGISLILFFMRQAYRETKYSTRMGMSSRLSRRGGNWMGKTASR